MSENTIPTVAERFRMLAQVARRRWLILVSVVAIATITAVIVASKASKEYESTAKVVLGDTQLIGVPPVTPTVPNPDPQRDINTKVGLITAAPVAQAVKSRLGLNMPLQALTAKVQTLVEGTSNIVDVTATASDPRQAAAIANAFVDNYVTFRATLAQSTLRQAASSVRQQLANLGSAARIGAQGNALSSELRALTLQAASETGGASVLAAAGTAMPASALSLPAAGFAGALLGLLVAVAIVAVLELTDRRVKDGEAIASGLGVRVLAAVPRPRFGRLGAWLHDRTELQAEAYDTLASQLVLAGRRRTLHSVVVTSPGTGDGKTTVTLGLASALARLDRRVVIIELDPRNSLLADDPEQRTRGGLSAVVAGASTVEDELVEIDSSESKSAEATARPAGGGAVSVLSPGGGELPTHRLLARAEIADVIAAGHELADFVLVDGPPTHRLHDALALVDAVDGALMVSRQRWTKTDSLSHGLETLDLLGMRVLGVVLTATDGTGTPAITSRNGAVFPLEGIPSAENRHANGQAAPWQGQDSVKPNRHAPPGS